MLSTINIKQANDHFYFPIVEHFLSSDATANFEKFPNGDDFDSEYFSSMP